MSKSWIRTILLLAMAVLCLVGAIVSIHQVNRINGDDDGNLLIILHVFRKLLT